MTEPSDTQPQRDSCPVRTRKTRRFRWTARHTAIGITIVIGAAAAILSYEHALYVTRRFGTEDVAAYLVPLLPDGLIGVGSAALYEAAQAGLRRPWQAVSGLVVGIVVTIILNVASGWEHGTGGRLLNALAPVALLIAVGVLEVMFRSGRTAVSALDGVDSPETIPEDQARDWLDSLIVILSADMTEREVSAALGVSRTRIRAATKPAEPDEPEPVLAEVGAA